MITVVLCVSLGAFAIGVIALYLDFLGKLLESWRND